MAYTTNRFCWHGLMTTDPEKAAAFYPEVMGWKTMSAPMGDQESTMFVVNDVPMAHYMKPPVEGVPSHWENYIRVDDVDAATKAAVENGGAQTMPPMDIPVGRFSVVSSPSGAYINFFHEADEGQAEHHPGGTGGVVWTELHSTDIDKDLEWLRATLGYETKEMPMPDGTKYHILEHGGEQRGGAMASQMKGAPSIWMSWFAVDDADAAAERVKANGGTVLSPMMDMEGIGRMCVVQDSAGAAFGIMKPAS